MEKVTYSLLVSNVGWVHHNHLEYDEVKRDYNKYVASREYDQVTLWSSENDDPIEEFYLDGLPALCFEGVCDWCGRSQLLVPLKTDDLEKEEFVCESCHGWAGNRVILDKEEK